MRYIAVKYNVAEHWFPRKDVQKAAKIDEFLNWQHLNIRQWCLEIFVNTVSMHDAPIQPCNYSPAAIIRNAKIWNIISLLAFFRRLSSNMDLE